GIDFVTVHCTADARVPNPVVRLGDGFEGLPSFVVRPRGQVFVRTEQAVEREEGYRKFPRHPLDLRLPTSAAAHFLKRKELSGIRIDRDGLALHDGRTIRDRGSKRVDDFGKLLCDVLEMTGEKFYPLRRDVCLHAQPVVLVLERG